MSGVTDNFLLTYFENGDSPSDGSTFLGNASQVDLAIYAQQQNLLQLSRDIYANRSLTNTGNAARSVALEAEVWDHWFDFGESDWVVTGLLASNPDGYTAYASQGRGYYRGQRVATSGSSRTFDTRLTTPSMNGITSASTSGSLTGGTYYYAVTALTSASGETTAGTAVRAFGSSTASITTYVNTITWNSVPLAAHYRVYRGTAASSLGLLAMVTTACHIDAGGAIPTAASPPATNTASVPNRTFYLSISADEQFSFSTASGVAGLALATVTVGSSGSITGIADTRILTPVFSNRPSIFRAALSTDIPIRAYGASGQSAILQGWYSSASALLASISATGYLTTAGINVGNATGAALGQIVLGDGAAGYIKAYDASTYRSLYLDANQYYFRVSGTSELSLNAAALYPSVDLGLNLGDAASRWNTTYTSAINVGSAVGAGAGSIYLSDGIGQGTIIAYNGSYHVLNVVGSSIILYVGVAAKAQLSGVSFGPFADLGTNLGSPAYRWNQLYTAAIAVGTNPSTTGAIQLGNAISLYARNAANSADLQIIGTDSSNRILLGGSSQVIQVNGVNYTFPASQGANQSALTNNGSGVMTWAFPEQFELSEQAGTLAVVTGGKRLYFPWPVTILGVRPAVGTPSSGTSIIVDLRKNGTTLWNVTPANKPAIPAGSNTITEVTNMDTTAFTTSDYLTTDIVQVGSGTAGADLTIVIRYRRS